MKKYLCFIVATIVVMLWTNLCFAQVTAEVLQVDLDDNGNIRVWCVHKIDGVEVKSAYPKINNHFVFCSRYSKNNFIGMDKTAIQNYILNDVKKYSEILVQKEFDKKASKTLNQIRKDYNASANQGFMDANLDKLVGKGVSVTEADSQIDSDNDGKIDKNIKIKTDGSKVETDIP